MSNQTSVYDKENFFALYQKLRSNPISLNEIVEKPTMLSLLPDLQGKKLLDLFKFDDSVLGRTKTTLVTFLPPLLLSLQFPYGFVIAIGYAGLAATIWAAIVPALLAKASRQKFPNATYKVYGGNFMIGFVILFGVLNIVAQVGANLGWFASFAG